MANILRRLVPSQAHNLHTIRTQPLLELSGSLGDLGTLLPLMLALALQGSISLSATLVFTGIANILTGLFFGIPLPVQPMKAIAAVAIAQKFSLKETEGAGLFVAGVIGAFSIAGIIGWIGRVVPIPVVKGIQVGAGLSLVISAGNSMKSHLGWTAPYWGDNYIWALVMFVLLIATNASSSTRPRMPYALVTFVVGLIIALIHYYTTNHGSKATFFGIWHPHTYVPSPRDFRIGTVSAGLGQLPLTTLNSIIAVTHLSSDLFPDIAAPSFTSIGLSVSVMNMIGLWFGAMPTCHGSGGLAAQYRFGARSGASIIVLGLVKLILGLVVNDTWLLRTLHNFPNAILGIMVMAAGVELAKVGESLNTMGARDLRAKSEEQGDADLLAGQSSAPQMKELNEDERRDRWTVMLITIAGLLAFSNDGIGFLAGLAWHFGQKLPAWWRERREFNSSMRPRWARGRALFGSREENEGREHGLLQHTT